LTRRAYGSTRYAQSARSLTPGPERLTPARPPRLRAPESRQPGLLISRPPRSARSARVPCRQRRRLPSSAGSPRRDPLSAGSWHAECPDTDDYRLDRHRSGDRARRPRSRCPFWPWLVWARRAWDVCLYRPLRVAASERGRQRMGQCVDASGPGPCPPQANLDFEVARSAAA
jgi:hypothetical protein